MVKLLKLNNGEMMVADVEEATLDNEPALRVKNPVKMAITPEGPAIIPFFGVGGMSIAKEPANGVLIKQSQIMVVLDVVDELVNVYKADFGGIYTPSLEETMQFGNDKKFKVITGDE